MKLKVNLHKTWRLFVLMMITTDQVSGDETSILYQWGGQISFSDQQRQDCSRKQEMLQKWKEEV